MALNDLSAVAQDDGMVKRIERIAYIEGYKSLLVKDNVLQVLMVSRPSYPILFSNAVSHVQTHLLLYGYRYGK